MIVLDMSDFNIDITVLQTDPQILVAKLGK